MNQHSGLYWNGCIFPVKISFVYLRFLLFHAQFDGEKISGASMADKRLGTLFANLMGDFSLEYPIRDKLNFIEQQMLNKLNEK